MTTGFAVTEELGRHYTFQSRLPQGEFFEIRPRILPHNSLLAGRYCKAESERPSL